MNPVSNPSPPRKSRYFVALLPPEVIQNQVTEIKQFFASTYGSRGALRSPPHITLQPPFEWLPAELSEVQACLSQFAATQGQVSLTLSGYGAFVPRVIYVNVLKTPELLELQKQVQTQFESLGIIDSVGKSRPYAPHMTVAFRDLSKQNFRAAWPQFQTRSLHLEFAVTHLTLLVHTGQRWVVHSDYRFLEKPA